MSLNLAPFEITARKRLAADFHYYALNCLKIRPKNGGILPFTCNAEQNDLHNRLQVQLATNRKVRAIVLKGRQQGMSTYIQARFFWKVTHAIGKQAFILTHDQKATDNIFSIANRYYSNCPPVFRPECDKSNAKQLLFSDIDSGYAVGTAKNKEVGRSSTIQYFHGSEVAFWENADHHQKGVLQTIPREDGSEIILESTANGIGNYFHQQWELAVSGESEFEAIFYPWFWHHPYRAEPPDDFQMSFEESELATIYELDEHQIYWRRLKIADLGGVGRNGLKAFQQEYPCNAVEAFHSSSEDFLIRSEWISRARAAEVSEGIGPVIIGVDPARFGNDKTAIIRRQGRKAYNLQYFVKNDTMQLAGRLKNILDSEQPAKMFIDIGGLGVGVYDRLIELGYEEIVEAVNFGERALQEDKYFNRRAEMWGMMTLWIQEYPVKIPDDDALHSDLVNVGCVAESRNRLKLEPKDNAAKRLGRSPDGGDALALTFAKPINSIQPKRKEAVQELLNYQQAPSSFWGA